MKELYFSRTLYDMPVHATYITLCTYGLMTFNQACIIANAQGAT